MATDRIRVTDVPQANAVSTADEFYIKTNGAFRRAPITALVALLRDNLSLPLVVNVLTITPVDDYTSALTLDTSLSAIQQAYTNRVVYLSMYGGLYQLSRVVSGARAEFTGPVYESEGEFYYSLFTITANSAQVTAVKISGSGGSGSSPASLPAWAPNNPYPQGGA